MKYVKQFEDEGFYYQLNVNPSPQHSEDLYVYSQPAGFCSEWEIIEKHQQHQTVIKVTDDQCEMIVFESVESAVKGAREFLSI